MKVCYIREKEDTCDFIKRIGLRVKRFFNIIDRKELNDKLIYYLPIFSDTKISKYKIKRLTKKIVGKLEDEGINNIALSKKLEENELLKVSFYSNNINILDGRFLFKCLSHEIIEYILKKRNKKLQERGYNFIS